MIIFVTFLLCPASQKKLALYRGGQDNENYSILSIFISILTILWNLKKILKIWNSVYNSLFFESHHSKKLFLHVLFPHRSQKLIFRWGNSSVKYGKQIYLIFKNFIIIISMISFFVLKFTQLLIKENSRDS